MKKPFNSIKSTLLLVLSLCLIQPLSLTHAQSDQPLTQSETLLDTYTQITLYPNDQNSQKAMDEAYQYIKDMASLFSEFDTGTDIYQVNQAAGKEAVKVAKETLDLVTFGKAKSEEFSGSFEINLGSVSRLWKDTADQNTIPQADQITEGLKHIGYQAIEINQDQSTIKLTDKGSRLDLGAISKGYIADGVAKIIKEHGIKNAIINLGGNLILIGSKPNQEQGWKVGIQNPGQGTGEPVGALFVKDLSVVTSGIYERFVEVDGKQYHHILDPHTGYPVDNSLASVSVITDVSLEADAYSTILFLLGLEKGMDYVNKTEGLEAIFITRDNKIHLSKGIKDFEIMDNNYQLATLN